MTHRELVAILREKGCEMIRQKGSHQWWKCGVCNAVVPRHREIAPGTLRQIVRLLEPCLGDGWLEGTLP
jgi:predicted RNA binding protein YcfA (HicA-like mRNA interferase family)